jgi:glycosyltransferase involved in cell wall biosynthesis
VVLFVGRLHPKKQPDILIRAFAACDAARNARLVLAGDGDQTFVRDLSGLARKLAIDDRLIFTGQLDREGVADAFARATVLALPSLQENLGFVALEAMAASKPVILSNRVGLADDVVAYDAGIVGEPTISTFVDALDRILRDPELGRCMGLAGSALARERYSWSTVTCEFECIYRDIINGSRMSSAWRDGVATG